MLGIMTTPPVPPIAPAAAQTAPVSSSLRPEPFSFRTGKYGSAMKERRLTSVLSLIKRAKSSSKIACDRSNVINSSSAPGRVVPDARQDRAAAARCGDRRQRDVSPSRLGFKVPHGGTLRQNNDSNIKIGRVSPEPQRVNFAR